MENRAFSIEYRGTAYEIATTFRKHGDELLFFLHGLGCSKESIKDIWFRDELSGYSILALDLVGFGDSSKSDDFSYKMEDQALVCAELVRKLFKKKVHIIAHSMGGAIGLLLPPALLDSTLSFANLEGNLSSEDCGLVSRKTISVPFEKFEEKILPDFKALSKSFGDGRFFLESASPSAFYKSAESLIHWSDSGELMLRYNNLPCRKCYFYGEKSAEAVALHRFNPLEIEMIGGSGHFMMNDNPDEFYPRLATFLKAV